MRVRGVAYEHGVLSYELQFDDHVIIRSQAQLERLAANLSHSHPLWLLGKPPPAIDPEGPFSKAVWLQRMQHRMDRWLRRVGERDLSDDPVWELFKQPGGGDLIADPPPPKKLGRPPQSHLDVAERVEKRLRDRKKALQDAIAHFNEALEATVDLQQSQQRVAELWLQLSDAHQTPLPAHLLTLNQPAHLAQQQLQSEAQHFSEWQEQHLEQSQMALRAWIQGPGEVLLQQAEDEAAEEYLTTLLDVAYQTEQAQQELRRAEQRLLHERSQPRVSHLPVNKRETELSLAKETLDTLKSALQSRVSAFMPEMQAWWIQQSIDLAEAFQREVETVLTADKGKERQ